MRLIAIIISVLTAVIMALASIHFWGVGQQYIPYENKFFQSPTPWVIAPWEQNFFLEQKKDLILWANVYATKDHVFLVAPTSERVLKNRDREQNPSPARPLLTDLLKKFPEARFILNITDNSEDIQIQVAQVLESEKSTERIMIQSDFNNVINSLKDLQPRMVYGSTPSDTMRLKSFQSVGILTAAPFKGDIYLAPLKLMQRSSINEGIAQELLRRFKKIIIGPLDKPEEAEQALSLGAQGLYTEKPEWLLQWLRDKK